MTLINAIDLAAKGYLLAALRESDLIADVLKPKGASHLWKLHNIYGRDRARTQVSDWVCANAELLRALMDDSPDFWESVGNDLWMMRNGIRMGFHLRSWVETPHQAAIRERLRTSAFESGVVRLFVDGLHLSLTLPIREPLDPPGSLPG